MWGSKNDGPPARLWSRPSDGGRRVPLRGAVSDAFPNHRSAQPHRWGDRAAADGSSGDLRPGRGGADSEGGPRAPAAALKMLPPPASPPARSRPPPLQLLLRRPAITQSCNHEISPCCAVLLVHSKGDRLHLPAPNPSPPTPFPLTTTASLFSGTLSPFAVQQKLAQCNKSTILQ